MTTFNDLFISQLDASGSLLYYPISVKVDSELSQSLLTDTMSRNGLLPPASCRVSASLGRDFVLDASAKMDGAKLGADMSLGLPPSYSLTSFKCSTDNLFRLHPGPDNKRQVSFYLSTIATYCLL